MNRLLLALCCVALFAGCPESSETEPKPSAPPSLSPAPDGDDAAPADDAAAGSHDAPATQTYDVICGCALPEVGHCGEYAKLGDAYVEIVGHDLGSMPFCGKNGLKAEISGHPSQGKLHAHSVKIVE